MRFLGVFSLVYVLASAVGTGVTWADPAPPPPPTAPAVTSLPEVKSKAAFVLDAETGAEIFAKDADEVRAIASTTKIFVAMVVRKKGIDLDGYTKISRTDVNAAKGGARTRLDLGETFKNHDLLRAMLMASDNRAPTALARAVGLEPDDLVKAMNKLAKELHLKKTKFTDTSGLRGNVSTAREMTIALRAALADPVLREVMATDYYQVHSKDGSATIAYGNTNLPLVSKKHDVIGGKTGFTKPAGYCFVTGAIVDGREVMLAFLGADEKLTRFGDFNRVATWLEAGAPGAKVALKKPTRPKAKLDVEASGRVGTAEPTSAKQRN